MGKSKKALAATASASGAAKAIAGDYAGAIAEFDRAFALSPDPDTLMRRGLAKFLAGDKLGAKEDYEQALVLYKKEQKGCSL